MLVDHSDSEARCVRRLMDPPFDAIDRDRSTVGEDQADQHLHERGLPRPVLAEDSMDSTAVKIEVNRVTRSNSAEMLLYSTQADRRGRCRSTDPCRHDIVVVGHPE
jgi:hypothetical protein